MATPLTPAEMHAFTEFLGMVPMIVIGFIVLVVVLIKTAPRDKDMTLYQKHCRGDAVNYPDDD